MSILAQICEDKMNQVERSRNLIPEIVLEEKIKYLPAPRGFLNAIKAKEEISKPALIAEIKKASPSKGIIKADFDPLKIARKYEEGGATCISVLTDQPYFKGRDEDLEIAKAVTRLPILRKDFMLTPYQILESRSLGADCILLIMAALDDDKAKSLYQYATGLGMDVLVEIHDEAELDRAMKLSPSMIGINARNLKTLEVDSQIALHLHGKIPDSVCTIAESGIQGANSLETLFEFGFDAFLVGETLMKEADPAEAVKKLLGKFSESE